MSPSIVQPYSPYYIMLQKDNSAHFLAPSQLVTHNVLLQPLLAWENFTVVHCWARARTSFLLGGRMTTDRPANIFIVQYTATHQANFSLEKLILRCVLIIKLVIYNNIHFIKPYRNVEHIYTGFQWGVMKRSVYRLDFYT